MANNLNNLIKILKKHDVEVEDWSNGVDIDADKVIEWIKMVRDKLNEGEPYWYVRSGNTMVIGTKSGGISITNNYIDAYYFG